MSNDRLIILDKLKLEFNTPNVCLGKDSGYYVQGQGFISLSKARTLTGIKAVQRIPRVKMMYGDYATIALINNGKLAH